MASEALEKVKGRKNFYRDYYRGACNVLWLVLLVILMLSLAIIYIYISRQPPDFYATSYDGKLVSLTPLETPNYSSKPLIQ